MNPWVEEGVHLLRAPAEVRFRPKAQIAGFEVSAHAPIRAKIKKHVGRTMGHKCFAEVLEFDTVPALFSDARFQKSFVGVGEKYLISGAAGTRLLNAFSWSRDDPHAVEADLGAHFAYCMTVNETQDLPVLETDLPVETDFAIVCRNTFNYFHFVTESLSQLTVLDGLNFKGRIYFHFPNDAQKQKAFARAFVDALFPELAEQVIFERSPKDYAHVLSVYETGNAFFMDPRVHATVSRVLPKGEAWSAPAFSRAKQAVVAMNSVSRGLVSLRERALRAIEGHDFSHLPKRFYVGRNDLENRSRRLGGEGALIENLSLLGFEYIVFESLSPLEQIALMAQAEVMVSHHGAGFTNMLFANPQATVIEIGTLQTAVDRWADFWPMAHASGCRYVSFFADFDRKDPLLEPHFATDGIVPAALGTKGLSQVMGYVAALCGVYPDFSSADALMRLAQRLFDSGAVAETLAVLGANAALTQGNAGLHLLQADCHKALDEPKSELVALDLAAQADPERWQTLVRMVWCAKRCDRPQVILWALDRLEQDFPDRYAAFVSNHTWVRFVA